MYNSWGTRSPLLGIGNVMTTNLADLEFSLTISAIWRLKLVLSANLLRVSSSRMA